MIKIEPVDIPMREREIFNLIQAGESFLLALVLKIELNFKIFCMFMHALFIFRYSRLYIFNYYTRYCSRKSI